MDSSESNLPGMGELLTQTVNRVTADPVNWLTGGVAVGIGTFVLVFVDLILLYGTMAVAAAPGMLVDNEEWIVFGIFGGSAAGLFGMVLLNTIVFAPLSASMHRAVWQQLETGEKLSLGSPFSTATQDLLRVILYQILSTSLVAVGTLFFLVPGAILSAALSFAGPAIYIHRLGIGEAVSLSWNHFQRYLGWHLLLWLSATIITFVLQNIPFVGYMLVASIHPLFVLLGYRAAIRLNPQLIATSSL